MTLKNSAAWSFFTVTAFNDQGSDQILVPFLVRTPTKLPIQPMTADEKSVVAKSKNSQSLTNNPCQESRELLWQI
jgi:hypothetical protein